MSSTPPAGASTSFGYIFDNFAVTYTSQEKSNSNQFWITLEVSSLNVTVLVIDDWWLAFFPVVAWMTTSCPLIFSTSPSIQAISGSSTQTWEPTMIFTGVPCSLQKHESVDIGYAICYGSTTTTSSIRRAKTIPRECWYAYTFTWIEQSNMETSSSCKPQ